MGRILLFVLLTSTTGVFAQGYFLAGITSGIGQSKLAPSPTPSISGFERFPAYTVGISTEFTRKNNPFSFRMEYWYEHGGDEGEGLRQLIAPFAFKVTFGDTWAPYGFAGLGIAYVMEKSISYKAMNISAHYGAGLEWKYNKRNRAYIQYIHLAGITSVYDELITPPGGSQILIENRHVRHYITAGMLFTLGYPKYYVK